MFAPSFWDHLEDRLNLAVFDTNQEIRQMNLRLRDLALSREKHVTPLPAAQPIVQPIQTTEKPKMSVTGLQSGAFKAKLAEMKQKMLDAQNQGLAQVDAAQTEAKNEIDTAIAGVASKIKSEVADALQEFSEFTNGGPA